MSAGLTASAALAQIPGWNPAGKVVAELQGGLNNRSYLVRDRGRDLVLRLDAGQFQLYARDRELEVSIMARAHAAGLGAEVVYADSRAGVLLREYLPGRVWTQADLSSQKQIEALAEILKRVHALPLSGHAFDLGDTARRYERELSGESASAAFAAHCVDIVAGAPAPANVVCAHNDIVAANVVEDHGLKLIDWEYACDSDPMFDLASAIAYHDLDARGIAVLLNAYTGGNSAQWRERLAHQVRVFDAIQWLWLANRQRTAPSDAQRRRLRALQGRIR